MEATLDKITNKIENGIAYYTENLDQLYRLVIGLALIGYLYSAVMLVWTLSKFGSDILLVPSVLTPLVVGATYAVVMSLFAIIVRKRLRDKHSTAITLFAVFLALNLGGFHIIVFMLGVWALFNGKFREHARDWSPEWYRKITATFD